MAMFRKKEDKYVDLSERMRRQQERIESFKSPPEAEKKAETLGQTSSGGGFWSFFGGGTNASNVSSEDQSNESPEERKKRLSKKLSDMTAKIEDLENQIYHMKQQIEVLEKKQKIGY